MSSIVSGSRSKPLNDREKRFCVLVSQGVPGAAAYRRAGYQSSSPNGQATNASRLLRTDRIHREVQRLKDILFQREHMTGAELIAFFAKAVRTPVGEVDPMHELCQEVTRKSLNGGDGPEIIEEKIKMVSKMDAAKTLVGIMGLNKPTEVKVDISDKIQDIVRFVRRPKEKAS